MRGRLPGAEQGLGKIVIEEIEEYRGPGSDPRPKARGQGAGGGELLKEHGAWAQGPEPKVWDPPNTEHAAALFAYRWVSW